MLWTACTLKSQLRSKRCPRLVSSADLSPAFVTSQPRSVFPISTRVSLTRSSTSGFSTGPDYTSLVRSIDRRVWDRSHAWLLGENPGQSDLRGCSVLLGGESADQIDDRLTGFAVLRREARDDVAEGAFVELRIFADCSGEKVFPSGLKGDKADAQFLERRDDHPARVSPPH
jgi:hypothetical protein